MASVSVSIDGEVLITDCFEDFPVVLPQWSHPFPFRTRT